MVKWCKCRSWPLAACKGGPAEFELQKQILTLLSWPGLELASLLSSIDVVNTDNANKVGDYVRHGRPWQALQVMDKKDAS
jgi:hypothetical protein